MSRLALLLVMLLLAHSGWAAEKLASLDAIIDALRQGQEVRLVIAYAQTTVPGESEDDPRVPGPNAIGGMKIDAWEWFAEGLVGNDRAYLATSKSVLISHPRYGHVYNYVRIRIYADGQVEIVARYLKTDSFEVVMDQNYLGSLDRAVSAFAVGD